MLKRGIVKDVQYKMYRNGRSWSTPPSHRRMIHTLGGAVLGKHAAGREGREGRFSGSENKMREESRSAEERMSVQVNISSYWPRLKIQEGVHVISRAKEGCYGCQKDNFSKHESFRCIAC